jgi:hypothetical protein
MATEHAEDIVRLVTAPTPPQAHIWQQALQDEGIESQVVGDFLDVGIGDVPGLTAELWVHRNDVARAEEILRKGEGGSGEEAGEVEASEEDGGGTEY